MCFIRKETGSYDMNKVNPACVVGSFIVLVVSWPGLPGVHTKCNVTECFDISAKRKPVEYSSTWTGDMNHGMISATQQHDHIFVCVKFPDSISIYQNII